MTKRLWYFHFDNDPCHKAISTKEFQVKKGTLNIDHPPWPIGLDIADFIYFLIAKMTKRLEGVNSGRRIQLEDSS
ncbi:Uncharacterized protein FKW44_004442, partial [Caligus rogercresseyi]